MVEDISEGQAGSVAELWVAHQVLEERLSYWLSGVSPQPLWCSIPRNHLTVQVLGGLSVKQINKSFFFLGRSNPSADHQVKKYIHKALKIWARSKPKILKRKFLQRGRGYSLYSTHIFLVCLDQVFPLVW